MSEELLQIPDLGFDTSTETPDLEVPAVDLETPETPDAELVEVPEGDSAEGESADGRKTPDAIRKALKSFREGSPEHAAAAKTLNDAYGRYEAFKQVFPTVKDAQAAHATIQTIESFGGVAGVQQTLSEIEEIDSLLKEGDVSVIDKLAEISEGGFEKLAPEMLNRLQKSNPEAWASAIKPHLASAMESVGMPAAIQELWKALQNSRRADAPQSFKDEAQEQVDKIIQGIYKWTKDLGKADPAPAPAAKGDDKLTAREQAIAVREDEAFKGEIGHIANPRIDAAYNKTLAPYFKAQLKSLTPVAREDLKQGIYAEIGKLVKADKTYTDQKNVLTTGKTRNAANAATLMASKFESIIDQATKSVINRRYGKAAPPVATKGAPAAQTSVGKGTLDKPILVKELPDRKDVSEKTTEAMLMRGIRILKNGSVVKLAD